MTERRLPLLAAAVTLAVTAASFVVGIRVAGFDASAVVLTLWAIVGALIVVLRPDNAVGWLFSVSGLLWVTGLNLTPIADSRGSGVVLTLLSWYSAWFWIAGFATIACGMLLVPTGKPATVRWRRVLYAYATFALVVVCVAAVGEELQASDDSLVVENPIGIVGVGDVADAGLGPLTMLIGLVLALVSLVTRYRRGGADERRRLKLIALAAAVMVACVVLGAVLEDGPLGAAFWAIAAGVFPVACAVAILRHRLFDIDRVISKTVVYGSMTVILGVVYVVLVLAAQAVFSSFAGGSDLAIAVSTLVVAALFLPVRSRVQGFVDRRFYRRRYDARRTLEDFGTRLRDHVELETLADDVSGVVVETMQPAHLTLWRRGSVAR